MKVHRIGCHQLHNVFLEDTITTMWKWGADTGITGC